MAHLIPIIDSKYDDLVKALNRVAVYDWHRTGKIHVLRVGEQNPAINAEVIYEYCQNNNVTNVLISSAIHLNGNELSEAGYIVEIGPSIKNIIYGNGLKKYLDVHKLGWRSNVIESLGHYSLGNVNEERVDRWLLQFEQLGEHRVVGEHLLKILDILPTADLGNAICEDSAFFGTELMVGFNQDRWGKSWATVSNLIKKKCPSASLYPITEALAKGQYPKVLRLVEDGLFSGTEILAIFDSLRGTRPAGRSQKVAKLDDPSVLSAVAAQLYFGVVCDFGEIVIRRYMDKHKLNNIHVVVGAAARKFQVLRGGIGEPPSSDCTDNTFNNHLFSRVVPFAFQDDKGWPDATALQRGKTFSEQIGEQLWRNFITQKQGFDAQSWPDERIKLCALGMNGLGLTFAFPHSVPRATLPLFWAGGNVTLHGKSICWTPLFSNADT